MFLIIYYDTYTFHIFYTSIIRTYILTLHKLYVRQDYTIRNAMSSSRTTPIFELWTCILVQSTHLASFMSVYPIDNIKIIIKTLLNIETVKDCREFFSFELPNDQLVKRVIKFESKVYRLVLQFNDC